MAKAAIVVFLDALRPSVVVLGCLMVKAETDPFSYPVAESQLRPIGHSVIDVFPNLEVGRRRADVEVQGEANRALSLDVYPRLVYVAGAH